MVVLAMTSCMTTEKATRFLSENGALAGICADSFPVQTIRDTTVVERKVVDQDILDSLAKVNAELQQKLDYIDGLPPVIDSSTCQDLRGRYAADIRKYQVKVNRLEQRLAELRARDTTFNNTEVDSAKVAAMRIKYEQEQQKVAALEKDRDEWKAKAKRRGGENWISRGIIALLLFGIGFIISKKRK